MFRLTQSSAATQFGTVWAALPDDMAATRMQGLSPRCAAIVKQALADIDAEAYTAAGAAIVSALAMAPAHPEVLRAAANLDLQTGFAQRAVETLQRVLAMRSDDVLAYNDLGAALRACGRPDEARAAWSRACEQKPDSAAAWFNLACNLDTDGYVVEAREAFEKVVAVAPRFIGARLMLADASLSLGEIERAAAEYRAALKIDPTFGEAWFNLSSIRTVRFEADEVKLMEAIDRRKGLAEQAQAALEFALAKGYEDNTRYADAFATYNRANARMRRLRPWDPSAFSMHVEEMLEVFSAPVANANDPDLGREVIFIVGLPRSGSTLAEQILASHPLVEGADELPHLMQVISEESARRGTRFPGWVAVATPDDWTRLGRRYLALTASWRKKRPQFTDKQPYNWLLAGAALAMLPGARVIDCQRDAMETCWSCYQQVFPKGAAFSYDLEHIVAFWKAHQRAAAFWQLRDPQRVRAQVYERLVEDPEGQTRELLQFCGLAFDPACLQFHRSTRVVRSASAAQVREPIRRDTARTARYGELLRPLRELLRPSDAA